MLFSFFPCENACPVWEDMPFLISPHYFRQSAFSSLVTWMPITKSNPVLFQLLPGLIHRLDYPTDHFEIRSQQLRNAVLPFTRQTIWINTASEALEVIQRNTNDLDISLWKIIFCDQDAFEPYPLSWEGSNWNLFMALKLYVVLAFKKAHIP